VSYLSEAAAQARRRYCRYPLTVRGYLFTLHFGGLAVAGPYPTSTLIRNYPGELGRSLSATCDPFGSLQLGALRAIPLALWKKTF